MPKFRHPSHKEIPIRYFGMNPSVFSRYLPYRYRRGQYFWYFKIGGSPLFPKEGGGLRPPFVHFALLLRDKRNSHQMFKKRVPAKSSKGVPAKSYIKNTQLWDFGKIVIPIPKYRPNSASNLPIPARGGVKKWDTTLPSSLSRKLRNA
jgi:hypothetical protein